MEAQPKKSNKLVKTLGILSFLLALTGFTLLGVLAYNELPKYNFDKVLSKVKKTVAVIGPKESTVISLPEFERGLPQELNRYSVLTLEKRNILILDDVITTESVAKVQVRLMKMVNELGKNEPIYLVLNTPGGSIDAGMRLIEVLKAQSHPVHTVTLFAASMGFITAQMLGDRFITPTGTLMSHRASLGGLEGTLDGEYENRLDYLKQGIHYLDGECAKRMGMTFENYKRLVHNEYWVHGFQSVEANVADKVALVKCGSSLSGKHTVSFMTLFGTVKVVFSDCPLIEAPLAIEFAGIKIEYRDEVEDFVNTLFRDKVLFINKYMKTNEYKKYLGD